jgi:hypothetical protein
MKIGEKKSKPNKAIIVWLSLIFTPTSNCADFVFIPHSETENEAIMIVGTAIAAANTASDEKDNV